MHTIPRSTSEFNDIQFLSCKRQALKIATEEMQERVQTWSGLVFLAT